MVLSRSKLLMAGIWLSFCITGCAHVPPNSGQTSFSSYAEAVFRHQNELSSRLMMLNASDQLPDDEEFEHTEEVFTDACQLLNEYAERESSGESMSLSFKAKVLDSVDGCDAGIKLIEALLLKLGK